MKEREAVRALVVDDLGRVLLAYFIDPVDAHSVWAPPGGGLEAGESDEQGLRRELREEVGLLEFELGPCLWTREHVFAWAGEVIDQRERAYLVRVAAHEPEPTIDLVAENVHGLRWWTPAELEQTPEELSPTRLPELVRGLLERGAPAAPVDAGF